ncbi:MAG: hypothetical protein UV82_C0005G0039, partial [Candidatus Magasanikbacteria bacterium GW2011_GWD2_43_18]
MEDIQSSTPALPVLRQGEQYWIWHGMFNSYKSLRAETTQKTDKKRLAYLKKQIIAHYFKNFFLFPIWFVRFLTPSYMKGDVNLWTNVKAITVRKEFKPLRLAILSQVVFLFLIVQLGITVFYKHSTPALATGDAFTQESWSGGATTTVTGLHPGDATGWTNYYSASSTISASTDVRLAAQSLSTIETSSADFTAGTHSATIVSSNSVMLSEEPVANTTAYTATGTASWVVPDGVDSVVVDVSGSQGSANMSYYSDAGGKGGRVQATYPVSAGQTLYIYVGERLPMYTYGVTAFNGGGSGGSNGGAGGGASDIRLGGTALTDRVIVGAGGGGGSYDSGPSGYGGYPDGMTGRCIVGYAGGGTQSSGGAGGAGVNGGPAAGSGSLGQGGYGGSRGGGGGGGYYGGGGCNYGGGAGGSSFADPNATDVTYTNDYRSGSGQVSVTYYTPAPVTTYYSSGTFISDVIALEVHGGFTTLNYTATLNGQTLTMYVRAGDSSDTSDGSWTSWTSAVSNGGSISSLGIHRYVQYKAVLSTNNTGVSPSIDDVTINYQKYMDGELIGTPFNTTDNDNMMSSLSWTASTTANDSIKFQLRSAPDGTTWSDWMGTDGTSDTYFTAADGSDAIPDALTDGVNDKWIQYKAIFSSTGVSTPVLRGITIGYILNAAPEVQNVTASQNSDGSVSITYEVRDTDTINGTILPTFQYLDVNGAWQTASTFSSGATSTKVANTEDTSAYTEYSLIWYPKGDYDEQYVAASNIRVTVDDSESANNTGYGDSNDFVLDTAAPQKVSFGIDARSDQNINITLEASDDTMVGILMKLSNASDLSADGVNASSGVWMAYDTDLVWAFNANPATVYYQFQDATGNTSTLYSTAAPSIPQNIVYIDISNAETSELQEFIAWETVASSSPGFKQYNISRSTDGETFSLLDTQTDRTINYYIDSALVADTTYYYKVAAQDNDDNISNYSNILSDIPDGQGGSDFTAPAVTNVAVSNIGPQTVTITWDTNEPADSTVEYMTNTGGEFTDADSVGIASMLDTADGLGQHHIVLTDLTPSTTYYFQIKSTDPSTNLRVSKEADDGYSFTTVSGPVISDIVVSSIANQTATIEWETDLMDSSYVYYSTSSLFGTYAQVGSDTPAWSHSETLTGLESDTEYYYYVQSGIAVDKHVVNGEIAYYNFITTNDTTAPQITFHSENDISGLSDTGAIISWSTDESATSTLELGTSTAYGITYTNDQYNTNHTQALNDLTLGTTYYVRLRNMDQNQNISSSTEFTFTTTDSTDITAPVIVSATTTLVTDVTAVITWGTDEGSSSQVLYGTSASELTLETTNDTTSNVNHTVVISDLTASTKYYYIVKSADANGNVTTSTPVQSFTTLQELSEEDVIVLREEEAYQEGYESVQPAVTQIVYVNSDTHAPTISDPVVTPVSKTSVTISWTADEASDGVVEYSAQESQYERTIVELPLSDKKEHIVTLSQLAPLRTYYYRVSSEDGSNNRSAYSSGSFTTGAVD